MLNQQPKMPEHLAPLYRESATGLELSNDVLETEGYLNWWAELNYPYRVSITC